MTRKHFRELTEAVASLRGHMDEEARRKVADRLAQVCRSYNPRLNVKRFYEACEV